MDYAEETTPLFIEEARRNTAYQEAPPSYDAVIKEQPQPVIPSAPPAGHAQQSNQLDHFPPQPSPPDPNTRTTTTTTTTTTYVTTTETRRTRESICCPGTYCPGFIFCFYVPTPCPANCDCNCLPPTTHCCGAGCVCTDCGGVRGSGSPVGIIFLLLIMLALLLVLLIGIIAFLIYRLGDDKPPAIAKRYRIFAVVFAIVGYALLIGGVVAGGIIYYPKLSINL